MGPSSPEGWHKNCRGCQAPVPTSYQSKAWKADTKEVPANLILDTWLENQHVLNTTRLGNWH